MDTVDSRAIEQRSRDLFESVWNGRMLGGIYDSFSHALRLYGPLAQMRYGREELIQELVGLLAEFPDARFELGKSLAGPSSDGGSSFFARYAMTGGEGEFSAAGLLYWRWEDDRIVEARHELDWLGILDALDLDREEYIAEAAGEIEPETGFAPPVYGELERGTGQGGPAAFDGSAANTPARLKGRLEAFWNRRDLGHAGALYGEEGRVRLPGAHCLRGAGERQAEALSLLAAFPDALFSVDELLVEGGGAALRWTLQGTHRGGTRYGSPSGKRMRIQGLSLLELDGDAIRDELSLFDELELMIRLEAARPEHLFEEYEPADS